MLAPQVLDIVAVSTAEDPGVRPRDVPVVQHDLRIQVPTDPHEVPVESEEPCGATRGLELERGRDLMTIGHGSGSKRWAGPVPATDRRSDGPAASSWGCR